MIPFDLTTTDLAIALASNFAIATALGLVAWGVQRTHRAPRLAHALWLVVLLKLVTPPLVDLPVMPTAAPFDVQGVPLGAHNGPVALQSTAVMPERSPLEVVALNTAAPPHAPSLAVALVLAVWLLGSVAAVTTLVRRVLRFQRELVRAASPAPAVVQDIARAVGDRLGLRRLPSVVTTPARVSPLLWWTGLWYVGSRPQVVLPQALVDEANVGDLRAIVAHELAHVARRDHWIRWLECFVGIVLWWNPLVWWARRNLRLNEEICCDALVLSTLDSEPRRYAGSLLTSLNSWLHRRSARRRSANTLHSGGSLERRFNMILAHRRPCALHRAVARVAVACALALLPLGLTTWSAANEHDSELLESFAVMGVSHDLIERVEGHLESEGFTEEQIELTFEALLEMIPNVQVEGKRFAMSPLVETYLTRFARFNESQLDLVEGACQAHGVRGEARARREGALLALRRRVEHALGESGFSKEQIDAVLEAAPKLGAEMKKEGGNFKLSAAWIEYLRGDLGLSVGQIEIVLDVSRRVERHHNRSSRKGNRRAFERIPAILTERGFTPEQVKATLPSLKKLVDVLLRDAKIENEGWDSHLGEELGLTPLQVEVVKGLALQLAKRTESREQGEGDHGDHRDEDLEHENHGHEIHGHEIHGQEIHGHGAGDHDHEHGDHDLDDRKRR